MSDPKSSRPDFAKGLLIGGLAILVLGGGGWLAYSQIGKSSRAPVPVEITEAKTDDTVRPDTAPQAQWIEWSEGEGADRFYIAGMDIRMGSKKDGDLSSAVMTVTAADGTSISVDGESKTGAAIAQFAVVQMDADSDARQVILSSFSYGAHCCTVGTLVEHTPSGWRKVDLGRWDGDHLSLPTDVDGDGKKEFVLADESFLYAFAPYAGSAAPPAIYAIEQGQLKDVSDQPRYRSVFQDDLAGARDGCREYGNGFCAAYAATAARVGQLDAAWPDILAGAKDKDWDPPAPCRDRSTEVCHDDKAVPFNSFGESLQWFLGVRGYTPPVFTLLTRPDGPAFDCRQARTASERMICDDRALRRMDARVSDAFTRALANRPDRAAVRAEQAEFLRERNRLTDSKLMLIAYERRLRELEAF